MHEPLYAVKSDVSAAIAAADADRYTRRYEWFGVFYQLAKLKPLLDAMFGAKADLGMYKTGECLAMLSISRDEGALYARIMDKYHDIRTAAINASKPRTA